MMSSAFAAVGRHRELGGEATMRGFAGYLLIGSLAALALGLAAIAGLGLSVGARPVAQPGQIIQYVDRTHKGDRLDIRGPVGSRAIEPVHQQPGKMPVGCEPAVSLLAASAHANDPGRCIAAFPLARTMAG
jgi:hypothetical protein